MIFRVLKSKHTQKQALREVYALVPGVPQYLDWSNHTIYFGQEDHLEYIPNPCKTTLIVDPIIRGY